MQNLVRSGDAQKSSYIISSGRKSRSTYTDNSLECINACEELHRSETHGIAERAVRHVKEGTSSILAQSGFLQESWWAEAVEAIAVSEMCRIC